MTTQQTHTLADPAQMSKRDRIPTLAGLALAAALVIGIGVRHTQHRSDARSTADPIPAATLIAAAATAAPLEGAGSHPESYPPSNTPRPGTSPSYLYLVASQEDAAFLRRFGAEINTLRVQSAQQPVEMGVMVMDGLDTSAIEGLPRTPGTVVFDLRVP